MNEVIVDAETKEVYYIQARPQEAGRCVVQTGWGKESKHVFGAGWNARSQVHEYGGVFPTSIRPIAAVLNMIEQALLLLCSQVNCFSRTRSADACGAST